MRILITNDDSISATQLLPLIRWCQKLGEVTVVVPEFEQSGMSHAIEIHKSFRATQRQLAPDITAWAVDSSPADCVRFAILGLHMEFDLVISGINKGYNIGSDIMYSGTVAALFEAAALDVPAIAFSTSPSNYENAVHSLDEVWAYFKKNKLLEQHNLYNVNIPPHPKSIRITCQGGPYYSDDFKPEENDYYHPMGKCVHVNHGDLTLDTDATITGHISIMPMTIIRADMDMYRKLSQLNEP